MVWSRLSPETDTTESLIFHQRKNLKSQSLKTTRPLPFNTKKKRLTDETKAKSPPKQEENLQINGVYYNKDKQESGHLVRAEQKSGGSSFILIIKVGWMLVCS